MCDQVTHAEELESPRVIKTHLPISMLSPEVVANSKLLVVMRNPKDCCASYYHHEKIKHSLHPDFPFDEYAKLFASEKVFYGSYWDFTKVSKGLTLLSKGTIGGKTITLFSINRMH